MCMHMSLISFSCEMGYDPSCTTIVVRIGTHGTVLYVYWVPLWALHPHFFTTSVKIVHHHQGTDRQTVNCFYKLQTHQCQNILIVSLKHFLEIVSSSACCTGQCLSFWLLGYTHALLVCCCSSQIGSHGEGCEQVAALSGSQGQEQKNMKHKGCLSDLALLSAWPSHKLKSALLKLDQNTVFWKQWGGGYPPQTQWEQGKRTVPTCGRRTGLGIPCSENSGN